MYWLNNSKRTRDSAKDLGKYFDRKLSFGLHSKRTVSSSFRILGFVLRTMKGFDDKDTCKTLSCTLVRSKLEYGIWSATISILFFRRHKAHFSRICILYLLVRIRLKVFLSKIWFAYLIWTVCKETYCHIRMLFMYKFLNYIIRCPDFTLFYISSPRTNLLYHLLVLQAISLVNSPHDKFDIFNTNWNKIRTVFNTWLCGFCILYCFCSAC